MPYALIAPSSTVCMSLSMTVASNEPREIRHFRLGTRGTGVGQPSFWSGTPCSALVCLCLCPWPCILSLYTDSYPGCAILKPSPDLPWLLSLPLVRVSIHLGSSLRSQLIVLLPLPVSTISLHSCYHFTPNATSGLFCREQKCPLHVRRGIIHGARCAPCSSAQGSKSAALQCKHFTSYSSCLDDYSCFGRCHCIRPLVYHPFHRHAEANTRAHW